MGNRSWQKLTAGLWPRPKDPSIHVDLTVDAEPMLDFLAAVEASGHRLTPTALLVRVLGDVFQRHPEANVRIGLFGIQERDSIDAWITMTDDEGRLVGRRVDRLHERDALDLQEEITAAGQAHKEGTAGSTRFVYGTIRWLPLPLLRAVLWFVGFLIHTLRLPLPLFGLGGRNGFGAVHVTNVGPFGLRHVAAPIPPLQRQPYLLTVGEIHRAPVVRGDEVVPARVLPITGTVDHRYLVGVRAATWVTALQELLTDKQALLSYLPEDLQETVSRRLAGSQEPR